MEYLIKESHLPKSDIFCEICLKILENPQECRLCGGIFCGLCLKNFQESLFFSKCPKKNCLQNEQNLENNFNEPSKKWMKLFESTMLKCPNEKCEKIVLMKDLGSHLKNDCICRIIKCTNKECVVGIAFYDLKKHLNEECEFRIVKCPFEPCKENYTKFEEGTHLLKCQFLPKSSQCNHEKCCICLYEKMKLQLELKTLKEELKIFKEKEEKKTDSLDDAMDSKLGDFDKEEEDIEYEKKKSLLNKINLILNNSQIKKQTLEIHGISDEIICICGFEILTSILSNALQTNTKLRNDLDYFTKNFSQKTKHIFIFALKSFTIDSEFDYFGNFDNLCSLSVISPRWIIKNKSAKIILKGKKIKQQNKLDKNKNIQDKNGKKGNNGKNGRDGLYFYGYGICFENIRYLQIDVSGGDGEDGQDGQDGADGRDYDILSDKTVPDDGGNGGDGGFGGEGGSPGNAYVFQQNKQLYSFKQIEKVGERGKNGQSGKGGKGGRVEFFFRLKLGKNGEDGTDGIYPPSTWEKKAYEIKTKKPPFGTNPATFIKKAKDVFICLPHLLKKTTKDVEALTNYEDQLFFYENN